MKDIIIAALNATTAAATAAASIDGTGVTVAVALTSPTSDITRTGMALAEAIADTNPDTVADTVAAEALADAALAGINDPGDINVWVTPTVRALADAAYRAVKAFRALADSADRAVARSRNQRETKTMIALAAAIAAAADRLSRRFGKMLTRVVAAASLYVKKALKPTPRAALLAAAVAAEGVADAAVAAIDSPAAAESAALRCEIAAGAWGVLGDRERARLWLERARTKAWFATDFE